jgi:hypothetical protein
LTRESAARAEFGLNELALARLAFNSDFGSSAVPAPDAQLATDREVLARASLSCCRKLPDFQASPNAPASY